MILYELVFLDISYHKRSVVMDWKFWSLPLRNSGYIYKNFLELINLSFCQTFLTLIQIKGYIRFKCYVSICPICSMFHLCSQFKLHPARTVVDREKVLITEIFSSQRKKIIIFFCCSRATTSIWICQKKNLYQMETFAMVFKL